MKVIVSPAKTLRLDHNQRSKQLPQYIEQSKKIHACLLNYSIEELKVLMKVSDHIAKQVYDMIHAMRFDDCGYVAMDTYDGIAFKALDAHHLEAIQREYLKQHLWILSGMYGIVRANDGIEPYRLELQTSLSMNGYKNLYVFWQACLKECLKDEVIINLASKEYDKLLRPLVKQELWYDVIFYVRKKDKLVIQSTQAKKARGTMLRYMAMNQVESVEHLKQFHMDGYRFEQELSSSHCLVFVKE